MSEHGSWYFTAPWDPVLIRRGDALGLRAGADYFADLLAPGLSNATSDARWISLLSWCLKWSHVVWSNAGGGDLSRRHVVSIARLQPVIRPSVPASVRLAEGWTGKHPSQRRIAR